MKFERMGIAKRWRSKKAVIKRLGDTDLEAEHLIDWLSDIDIYIQRQEAEHVGAPPEGVARKGGLVYQCWFARESNQLNVPASLGYISYAGALNCLSMAAGLAGQPWSPRLAQAVAYQCLGVRLNLFWQYQLQIESPQPGRPGEKKTGLRKSIVDFAETMGQFFVLGHIDEGIQLARLGYAAATYNFLLDLDEKFHRRAQTFMLRLVGRWNGLEREWPAYAYDEPVYEWLLDHWNTPDPEALVPALLAACDRHTHQSWDDTTRANHDFHNVTMYRFPVEVLLLYRLRELEGLSNPVLDHPLCEAPFDRLPPPQPRYEDERMRGSLKRVREDWPYFDQILQEAIDHPLRPADYSIGRPSGVMVTPPREALTGR